MSEDPSEVAAQAELAAQQIDEVLEQINVGAAYEGIRERLSGLLSHLGEAEWEQPVPHCPDWTVRQTLSHLVGVVDDAVNGNLSGAGTDEWTKVQVDLRAEVSGPQLLTDWNNYAPFLEAALSSRGLGAAQAVFDAVTHEHDLRFALGTPGARTSDAMWVAAHFIRTRIASEVDVALVLDGVEVTPARSDASLRLTASVFDAVRLFASRRTEAQVRGLVWSADPTSVVKVLPFTLPTDELRE